MAERKSTTSKRAVSEEEMQKSRVPETETSKEESQTPEVETPKEESQTPKPETLKEESQTLEPEAPKEEGQTPEPETPKEEHPAKVSKTRYVIQCRNNINKTFGGVTFANGIAKTEDAYTASWFRAKAGYNVSEEKI